MALSIVNSTGFTKGASSGVSTTLNLETGGDYVMDADQLALSVWGNINSTFTSYSGSWTRIGGAECASTFGYDARWRGTFASETEETLIWSASFPWSLAVVGIAGIPDISSPFRSPPDSNYYNTGYEGIPSADPDYDAPSIANAEVGDFLVCFYTADTAPAGGSTWTLPAGMTELAKRDGTGIQYGCPMLACYKSIGSAGATGVQTATLTGTSEPHSNTRAAAVSFLVASTGAGTPPASSNKFKMGTRF